MNNSKLVSLVLLFAGLMIGMSCIFVSVRPVQAKMAQTELVSNQEKLEAHITNIKSVTIEAEKASEVIRPIGKVTTKVSKKVIHKMIQSGRTGCWIHTLEQQGSPTAETVKVCEF